MPDPLPPDTTIAELAAQGYTHLEKRCICGITMIPFQKFQRHGHPKKLSLEALYNRMRCPQCHKHPDPGSLRGWRQSDAQGYVTNPGLR